MIKTFSGGKKTVYVKFSGNQQPYLAYNVARIRQADEDVVMSQEMYSEILLSRGGEKYSWEYQPSEYTIEDINLKDFKLYLKKAKGVGRIEFESDNPGVVLEKLSLIAEDGMHLLNAGAALFCNSTTNDVQMAKFATDVKAAFTDIRREDKGSIIGLLSENNKLNQKQIAAYTGKSIASVQRTMKKLLERGKIMREGGKRFGWWKIK